MNIQITGRHVEITDALRSFINEKFVKLERHSDNITQIHIMLGVQKEQQTAEAEIHISGGNLFAQSTESSMYAAIDMLIDKLDRQLIKHKEKLKNHHGQRPDFAMEETEETES